MKPLTWIIATAISAVMMISYVHAFIYPRTEGEKLEQRVRTLDEIHRQDMREIKQMLMELIQWQRGLDE